MKCNMIMLHTKFGAGFKSLNLDLNLIGSFKYYLVTSNNSRGQIWDFGDVVFLDTMTLGIYLMIETFLFYYLKTFILSCNFELDSDWNLKWGLIPMVIELANDGDLA